MRSFWKTSLLFMLLACATLLPANSAAQKKDAPASVIVFPLEYYGPLEKQGLAGEITDGLKRRLEARGINATIAPEQKAHTLPAIVQAARSRGASKAIYGSVSYLFGSLSINVRFLDLETLSTEPILFTAAGTEREMSQLLDRVGTQLESVLAVPNLISKVKVQGNRRIGTDAILQVVSTRAGETLDLSTISKDIKNIYKLGYFDDIRVDVSQGPKGKIVTFLVREKPAIRRITFIGNKVIKDDKIRETIDLKPYSVIQEKALQENAEKIKALYAEKGYAGATVAYSIRPVSEQAADVVFEIKEGEKVQIKKISFQGVHAFSEDDLKDLMETSEKRNYWIPTPGNIIAFFKGKSPVLKSDALDRDLGRIAAFYHNHGYVEAKVGRPRIRREGKWLYIKIPVEEGTPYKIGSIDIDEDYFHDKELLFKELKIKPGETFNREILRRDILKITDRFADEGFAYADVNPKIHRNPDKKTVDITFVVNKGPKVTFERIEISGNTRTRDKVIRRELRVMEGEPFTATGLRKSRDRLNRLGYFEDVSISPARGSRDDTMKLDVQVKERPTGTFSVGAGYSSVDKLILMGEISQRNFLGKGQTLSFKGILGSTTNRFTFSFTEPYFRDTRLSVGIDAYNWEREYDDYTKDSAGGALRLGYPLTDNLRFYLGLRIDNTTLSDVSDDTSNIIRDSMDIRSTRSLSLGLIYDNTDRYFFPRHGWHISSSVEHAGGFLGGDSAYTKLEGIAGYYHPLWKDLIGHLNGGIGYVVENSGGKLPVYERFFLGGMDSVRGFKWGRISPVDPETGERIGGEYMAYLQTEAIFPLIKSMGLHGLLFLDMGNVWDKDQGYDMSEVRKSAGFGIRWLSPMGPLRIEWGYNLDRQPGEDRSNWEFRIGGAF